MGSRRQFLSTLVAGAGVAGAGCLGRLLPAATSTPDGPAVGLEPVASGLVAPVGIEFPSGTDLGYAVDQAGRIWVVEDDGRRSEPFLDVTDRMVSLDGYSEQGLLGLAFHPEFPDDDRAYVRYSAPSREGTPAEFSHTFVLAEFRADPERAAPDSERTVLEIPQPQGNHNAGSVAFGPDGYCYVGVGDGGAGGDRGTGHVEDWYGAVPGGNGQDLTGNLLGSILRIDVDGREGDRPYAVPDDNPLVGREGLDEQYAWGFRNPWRFSFDDGRLFVADVGQNRFEEVNLVERGGNYGWNVTEGRHCFDADECPDETPDGAPLRDPILEYPHERGGETVGVAVVGGHVYRGSALPGFSGAYLFGDWSSSFSAPQGSLFLARPTGDGGSWTTSELSVAGTEDGELGRFVLGFGRDPDGEVYVCTSGRSSVGGSSGVVYRFVPADGSGTDDGTTTAEDPPDDEGTTPSEGTATGDGTTGGEAESTTSGEPTPGLGPAAALLGIGAGVAARWWRRRR